MSDDLSIPSPTYRVPRHRRGMDPGTRRLALIAAGIGGFLIVVGGGWHMLSRHTGAVPVIWAEPGPIRVKPANPGGLQVAGTNNDIFSGGLDTSDPRLAPPPQTPDPRLLQAMEAPKPAAAPAVAAQPAATPSAPAAAVPAAAPPPAPVQASREAPAAPAAQAEQTRAVQAAASTPPPHAFETLAATAASHPAPGGEGVQVQLAALSTEQAAHEEWGLLLHRWPDLLRGHPPSFSRIAHDGHVFWRVRASGFEDLSDAAVFCERIRAHGGGCSVADF